MSQTADANGWTAVPRSQNQLLQHSQPGSTKPYSVDEISLPSSPVAKQAMEYAKQHLPLPTFNHSMRVFYYGMAMLQNHGIASVIEVTPGLIESFFLSCMLHDIGTAPDNIKSTRLSFELWGAIHALQLLPTMGAAKDQTELVAEVINRHQDLGETGQAPAVLGLIYFATIFDNVGLNASVIHRTTIENVTRVYPRMNWSGCFAATVREETGLKPWSHTTVIDRFAEQIEANELMEPFE